MAHCQKEISCWRTHTQLVLYFEGAAVPTADPQILAMRAPVATLVEKPKGGVVTATCFPWAALGSEDVGRGPGSASCTVSRVTELEGDL